MKLKFCDLSMLQGQRSLAYSSGINFNPILSSEFLKAGDEILKWSNYNFKSIDIGSYVICCLTSALVVQA